MRLHEALHHFECRHGDKDDSIPLILDFFLGEKLIKLLVALFAENASDVSQLAELVQQDVDLHDEAEDDEPLCHHEDEIPRVRTAEVHFSLLLDVERISNVINIVDCRVEAGKFRIVKLPCHYYMSSFVNIPTVSDGDATHQAFLNEIK